MTQGGILFLLTLLELTTISVFLSSCNLSPFYNFTFPDDLDLRRRRSKPSMLIVNLRNRTEKERRRQALCDKRDNNFV